MSIQLLPVEQGQPVEVPEGLTLVGRDFDCDVRLSGGFVSKMHCVLVNLNGCLLVRDLGSTNGTRVNGERIRSARLRHHDRLCIGELSYLVVVGRKKQPQPELDAVGVCI